MERYAIYAGMGGSFGGANLQTIDDFNSREEADELAYQMALEEYKQYEGSHGILNWFECREDLLDSFPDMEVDDEDVDMRYLEEVESWIDYYVLPVDLIPPEDLE